MEKMKVNKIPDYKYGYLRTRFAIFEDNVEIKIIQKNILDAVTSEKKMLIKVTLNEIFKVNPDYNFKSGYYLIPDNDELFENTHLTPSFAKAINNSWELARVLMADELKDDLNEDNYPHPAIYKHFKGTDYCVYLRAIGQDKEPYFVYTRMIESQPQIYCRSVRDFIYSGDDISSREENVTGQKERFKLISTFIDM